MFAQPTHCSRPGCAYEKNPPTGFMRKRGYFTCRRTGRQVARYQCKLCHKTFSNRTFAADKNQKRPDINPQLASLLASGVTQRRSAKLLKIAYNTVCRRVPFLANLARLAHDEAHKQGVLATSFIQFDEMQSFEHSAAKPLTIALAVRVKTGQILAVHVGRITAKGHLAHIGKTRYGWTVNESPQTCYAVLLEASRSASIGVTVECDGMTSYPNLIHLAMPTAIVMPSARAPGNGAGTALRKLNHVCAKIRADIARLARRTWTTTKKRAKLQELLDIYVAWNNRYDLQLQH